MKIVIEKNTDAPGLSRASCIAMALMRATGAKTFAELKNFASVASLSDEQRELLIKSRYHLDRLTLKPEATLAVCDNCGKAYTRTPSTSLPKRCTLSDLCRGEIVWAGRARVGDEK
ncbi:hypothetical protein [Actinomyces vulturis]|uniref:hypothetical protein n=1 Tax=Actinomyces vulturis TaxID=1857645 RepID=UPI00082ADB1B|nr:hypothetical protein [Actinomyces vulturis]